MSETYSRVWQQIDWWQTSQPNSFIGVVYQHDKDMLACLEHKPSKHQVFSLHASETSQATRVRLAQCTDSHPDATCVHMINWYRVLGDEAQTYLENLNAFRESFLVHLPVSLVLWIHQQQVGDFSRYAGDIWAWTHKIHLEQQIDQGKTSATNTSVTKDIVVSALAHTQDPTLYRSGDATSKTSRIHRAKKQLAEEQVPRVRALLLSEIATLYYSLAEYYEAIKHYTQALAISRDIGDKQGEGNRLGNLGNAYASLGEVDKAIEYHTQALAIARDIGDKQGEGNHLGNLGNAYADLGDSISAQAHWQQALGIFETIGSPHAATVRRWLDGA